MIYPKEFSDLMDDFKKLPGIGEKTAERYVYAIDHMDQREVSAFSDNLNKFKKNIVRCKICGHYSNTEKCSICSNENREKDTICVVEDSKTVFMFEKAGNYKGLYHVLGGLISPIDDINPEDINISSLINKRLDETVKEVIIAINSSVEGETTSLYLQKLIKDKKIKVSRLSYGIPMGSDIEYLDPLTITRAIDDRKFLS